MIRWAALAVLIPAALLAGTVAGSTLPRLAGPLLVVALAALAGWLLRVAARAG